MKKPYPSDYGIAMALLVRLFLCLFATGFFLYRYVDHQNNFTAVRLQLPSLKKELQRIEEDNAALRYEVERFESPQNLLRLSRQREYAHLRYPHEEEVIEIRKEREE